jgi:LysR family transcriptional regulator, regulator for bpeEF and oprC
LLRKTLISGNCVAYLATASFLGGNIQNLDLNRLQIFRAIVLNGSISKAAVQLGQPKSRVSRQLSSLEGELGSQLIYRTTRQFQLTPSGQELFSKAVPLLNELEGALATVATGTDEVSGRLRVTAPEDIGTALMGGISQTFLAMYPKVSLEIHVSNQRVDLVRDQFDLAIRIGKMKDSTLIQKKLGNINLVPYLSPELRSRMPALNSPSDLSRIPYVAFSPDFIAARKSLRLSNGSEVRPVEVKPIFVSNSFFVNRGFAVNGLGFTVLPPFLAKDFLARGELVPAFRDWVLEGSAVHTVIPNQKEIPQRTKKFIEHVRAQLSLYLG